MTNMQLEQRLEFARQVFAGLSGLPRIPELDIAPQRTYVESTLEEVLFPLIRDNDVIVVSGAFFGDEGKGKTVDAIARHPLIRMIMRANSGENAGHTVVVDGVKYVFHLMPSGILIPGKTSLIGPECVMDPITFMGEAEQLTRNGKSYDNLYIGNVQITTPYHKLMDFLGNPTNSSTLRGISPVHSSKMKKRGLRLDDLFRPADEQAKILLKDMEEYIGMLRFKGLEDARIIEMCDELNSGGNKRIPDHVIGFLKAGENVSDKIDFMIDLYDGAVVSNSAFPKQADTRRMLRMGLKRGEKCLIECAQSYWLRNPNVKHWRSSTSADTGASGTIASAGYNPRKYRTIVINVEKQPDSRVGLGENVSGFVPQDWFSSRGIDTLEKLKGKCERVEDIAHLYFDSVSSNGILRPVVYEDTDGTGYMVGEALAIAWARKFGECGATTKKPRVLGLFDCVMGYEMNDEQGPYLTISAMDRFDDCDKVGIVVGYVFHDPRGRKVFSEGVWYENGTAIRPGDQIPGEQVLRHCHQIIKVMDGWKGTPIWSEKRKPGDPLPKSLQDFVSAIEQFTEAQVISLGNGEESSGLIYIKNEGHCPRY
jgi:adenylosuccinate synthase